MHEGECTPVSRKVYFNRGGNVWRCGEKKNRARRLAGVSTVCPQPCIIIAAAGDGVEAAEHQQLLLQETRRCRRRCRAGGRRRRAEAQDPGFRRAERASRRDARVFAGSSRPRDEERADVFAARVFRQGERGGGGRRRRRRSNSIRGRSRPGKARGVGEGAGSRILRRDQAGGRPTKVSLPRSRLGPRRPRSPTFPPGVRRAHVLDTRGAQAQREPETVLGDKVQVQGRRAVLQGWQVLRAVRRRRGDWLPRAGLEDDGVGGGTLQAGGVPGSGRGRRVRQARAPRTQGWAHRAARDGGAGEGAGGFERGDSPSARRGFDAGDEDGRGRGRRRGGGARRHAHHRVRRGGRRGNSRRGGGTKRANRRTRSGQKKRMRSREPGRERRWGTRF